MLPRWSPWPWIGSIPAYDPISCSEATLFGKEFLRMAGIVKMLHSHKPQYDPMLTLTFKYPYANRKRAITVQRPGPRCESVQVRQQARVPSTLPEPHRSDASVSHVWCRQDSHIRSCSIWLILINLLTLLIPSINTYQSEDSA